MTVRTRLVPMAIALLLPCTAAWPAGGGSGGSNARIGSAEDTEEAALRDPDYRAGMAAAKARDWQTVVARMRAYVVRDPKNADVWNELGHAYRQLGDLDNAFRFYEKALQLDPRHKNAREYLGEAYLQAGNLEGAEQQLKALDRICTFPCEQYKDLKQEIERYRATRPVAAKP